jgi:hypothetical protein
MMFLSPLFALAERGIGGEFMKNKKPAMFQSMDGFIIF